MRRPKRPSRRPPGTGMFGVARGPQRNLGDRARQLLDEANRLFDTGQFAPAADMLAQLADGAEAHGMPRRAAQLHLRAGQAYMKSRNAAAAVGHARHALAIFAGVGLAGRVAVVLPRLIAELRAAGFQVEADSFEREANEKLAAHGLALACPQPAAAPPSTPRTLNQPTKCPQCGAQLRWLDRGDDEMECEYCGTIVRAE